MALPTPQIPYSPGGGYTLVMQPNLFPYISSKSSALILPRIHPIGDIPFVFPGLRFRDSILGMRSQAQSAYARDVVISMAAPRLRGLYLEAGLSSLAQR